MRSRLHRNQCLDLIIYIAVQDADPMSDVLSDIRMENNWKPTNLLAEQIEMQGTLGTSKKAHLRQRTMHDRI